VAIFLWILSSWGLYVLLLTVIHINVLYIWYISLSYLSNHPRQWCDGKVLVSNVIDRGFQPDEIFLALDQYVELNFYSASSLKQSPHLDMSRHSDTCS
jgi:hypothetical protein